jgi:hypothetical protein
VWLAESPSQEVLDGVVKRFVRIARAKPELSLCLGGVQVEEVLANFHRVLADGRIDAP